jgi:hypothetical protein
VQLFKISRLGQGPGMRGQDPFTASLHLSSPSS